MSPSRSPDAPARRTANAGFTLIEVLVALALCGFVIAAMAPVFGNNLMQARRADERLALAAAQRNLLEILPGREELRTGTISGNLDAIRWTIDAAEVSVGDPAPGERWIPYRISALLVSPGGLTARFETLRLGRAPTR